MKYLQLLRIAICCTVFSAMFVTSAYAVSPPNTIKVIGAGQVMVIPDKLSFNILLREQGRSVSKLYASVNQSSELIISYLGSQDVVNENLQSMAIQVNPWTEYENQRRVQKGFELSRIITVTLEDSEKLGTILDHIFRINNVEISGVNLLLTNRQSHYNNAMQLAIDSAKDKAQLIAKQLSVSLGAAMSFKEISAQSIAVPETMMRTQDMNHTFLPGEVSVMARVEVEFFIQ